MTKVNKKPSNSVTKRAKHAKAIKEMELTLQAGDSGLITVEDNASAVEEETPGSSNELVSDTLANEEREEYSKMRKELKSLRRKFKIAFATADYFLWWTHRFV